jgi:hypothetical protein
MTFMLGSIYLKNENTSNKIILKYSGYAFGFFILGWIGDKIDLRRYLFLSSLLVAFRYIILIYQLFIKYYIY